MQFFSDFTQQYGSYTFKKRGGITRSGNKYTSSVFFLNLEGQLELRITKGTVWKHDGVTETIVLQEQDFTDENLLAELLAELEAEAKRRSALSLVEAGARSRVSLVDAIAEGRLSEGMEGVIV